MKSIFFIILIALFLPFPGWAQSSSEVEKYELNKLDAVKWKRLKCKTDKTFLCDGIKCESPKSTMPSADIIFDKVSKIELICHDMVPDKCFKNNINIKTEEAITKIWSEVGYTEILGNEKYISIMIAPYFSPSEIMKSKEFQKNNNDTEEYPINQTSLTSFGTCQEIE